MSISLKASELAREILQSNEHRELIQAKQVIDRNRDYQNRIKEFKGKQFDFQMSLAPNRQPDKMKMDNIKKHYDELIKNADLKRYFDAEQRFNQVVAEAFKVINDKIENSLK